MHHNDGLEASFEGHRQHLRAVALRMLGSQAEADDALQIAWLKVQQVGLTGVTNPGGWLTTVVSRVCLDLLRTRQARREQPLAPELTAAAPGAPGDPEGAALAAESVGLALLVVLDRLGPAERVAFVLHDVFGLPFADIAEVLGRSVGATKKLASRSRQRVQGVAEQPASELARQRLLVQAYLDASRSGDVDRVVALLAPDVVRRADRFAVPAGVPAELRGALRVAGEARVLTAAQGHWAAVALVDGRPGIIVAPGGRLRVVLAIVTAGGTISGIDVIGDPAHLARLALATGES